MKKLTGERVRQIRRAARCPDCRSDVTVNRRTGQVDVSHDDTCPLLPRLQRARRTTLLAFVRPQGQSPEDFAREVTEAAAELSRQTGQPHQVSSDPYRGLP